MSDENGISFEYESASTIFPGRIHLSGVRLRADGTEPFRITMGRAEIDIGLLALLRRDGHIKRVHGQGLRVELDVPRASVTALTGEASGRHGSRDFVMLPLLGAAATTSAPLAVSASKDSALRIDSFESSAEIFAYGNVRIRGEMTLTSHALYLQGANTSFGPTTLAVKNADLLDHETSIVTAISGHLDARSADSEQSTGSTSSLLPRTTAHVELEGALPTLAPFAKRVGLSAHPTPATINVTAGIDHGIVSPSSALRIQAESAVFEADRGPAFTLDQGLVATLGSTPSNEKKVQLEVGAPHVVLSDSDGQGAGARFEGADVAVDLGDANLAIARPEQRSVRWRIDRAFLHMNDATVTGALNGELVLKPGPLGEEHTEASHGTIAASNLVVTGHGTTPRKPIEARVDLSRADLSSRAQLSLVGQVHARGGDAGALLDLVGAKGAARIALDSIEGKPFDYDSTITRNAHQLALEQVVLSSDTLAAHGAYYRTGNDQVAAFLLEYGSLSIGISLDKGVGNAVFSPPPDWLDDQTRVESNALER